MVEPGAAVEPPGSPGGPAEDTSPGTAESDPQLPSRRPRSAAPWWAAVGALAVVVVLLLIAYGIPSLPSFAPPSGGGAPGGGGPSDPAATTIVPSGTEWAIGASHYEAVWFPAPELDAVSGGLSAAGALWFYVVPTSALVNWSGANSSNGPAPTSGPLAAAAAWSANATTSATLTQVQVDPGSWDLVIVNSNPARASSAQVTTTVSETPVDVS